ncbi:hypothetical protein GmHk_05G014538 [Glycine max]|nr:hypothetical protein GmHk_05G014538 [Glycine max]
MAMASLKVMCRFSCRLQSVIAHNHNKFTKPSLSPVSLSAPRLSRTSRLPVELGCLESMMPFHSVVASARLVSSLSIESLGWGLVPQELELCCVEDFYRVFPCLYDSICLQLVAAR